MKDLLLTVMTVSLGTGIVNLLAPEGKMKKQITFVTALVLCAALFAPLVKQMGRELSFDFSLPSSAPVDSDEAKETILRLTADALCRQLEDEVSYRFAVTSPSLTLTLDGHDPSAVTIVSGHLKGVGEVEAAAAYLTALLRCSVTAEAIVQEESHG
ncbi:MAG: hypothetical protein E7630_02920 [Ruminococcaceae bacterium]|nr:hypothetical protein [Oscillospiraceae bacterium]